jgi:hypothetical protein
MSNQCSPNRLVRSIRIVVLGAVMALAALAIPWAASAKSHPAPSAHGCSGFDGTWQGPAGTMQIHNGSGLYGQTKLQGTLYGTVLRGKWTHPTVGQGTFEFTLAPGGDSFTTVWTSPSGVSGSFDTVRCIGPYSSQS